MESKLFTPENDELLIALVRDHPVLYKLKDKNYRDNNIKDNVWKEISFSIGKSANDCKTRWRTIRDSYKKTLKKMKMGTGSAAKNKSKYNDDALSFLNEQEEERRTKSSIMIEKHIENTASLDCSEITVSDSAHQTENYNSEMYIEPTSETSINEYDNNLNNTSNVVPNEIFKNDNEKQKKGGNKERLLQEIRQGREERLKMFKEIKQQSENHPIQIFFKSMASTVMTFSPELVVEARNRVCNIVSEIELRALKTNISMGTMDQETASTIASEESLQSYSRIPVDEPNPNNNNFTYLNYLPMTYD
ncbi:hypothetical protein ACI65C_004027 [Semiaphis heraclei]